MKRTALILMSCSMALTACGDDSGGGGICTENETRCGSAVNLEICAGGQWILDTDCSLNGEVCEQGACVPDVPPDCGNGSCDGNETCATCPDDCGQCQCDTGSPEELMFCADRTRFAAHLDFVTGVRTPGSSHWQAVQDHCASTLQTLGYTVERQDYGTGVNVIGTLAGAARPDEKVVLGAHYDHIFGCEGADDNASGVAAILEIAEVLSTVAFDRTLEVVCFDEEEVGLIGSSRYARRANNNFDLIAVLLNLDMIAYADDAPGSQGYPPGLDSAYPDLYAQMAANDFRANFIFFQNDHLSHNTAQAMLSYAAQTGRVAGNIELTADQRFDPAYDVFMRSDHAAFWFLEYPAITVNDTAEFRSPYYHCADGADAVGTLDMDFAMDNLRAALATTAYMLDHQGAVQRPPVVPCADICNGLPSMTVPEMLCIEDVLATAGMPQTPQCGNVTTIQECNACFASLSLQAGDCSILSLRCL